MQLNTSVFVLPAMLLAGCVTNSNADLTPTPEESEYMGFVASEGDDVSAERACVTFTVDEVIARAKIGEVSQTAVLIENNCAGLDIGVRAFELFDEEGAFWLDSEVPSVLPGDSTTEILVSFEAQADIIHLAEFRLLLDEPVAPVKIAELYGIVPRDSDRSGDPPNASTGGGAFSIETGAVATLDGTASSDPELDTLSYTWSFKTLPGGSALSNSDITNRFTDTATFTPDVDGSYRVRLVVSDGTSIDKTFATYSATTGGANTAPTADAGASQFVATGEVATHDGSGSSDPELDSLTYTWTMTSPAAGSSVNTASLSGASTDTASYTTDVAGFYILKLLVNDGVLGDKDFTTTFVSDNATPVSDPGADQSVDTGALVTLDGSGSSDADGDTLTYTWSFKTIPGGSSLSNTDITDRTTDTASFTPDVDGTYRLRLTVNDGVVGDVAFVDITATTP